MPSFLRNVLVGPAAWIAVLAAGIVVPILALTVVFVRDIERLSAAAYAERAGIAHLIGVDRVFRDASDYRAARRCGRTGSTATIDGDLAAVTALERRDPFVGAKWAAAVAAWRDPGSTLARADALATRIAPLFVAISDRSGVTYDPEVAGIDLADALAYRLPRAAADLQQVELLLCRASRTPGALPLTAIARAAGASQVLLLDAYGGDIDEAVSLDRTLPPNVGRSVKRSAAATGAAFALLSRLDERSSSALLRRAQAATRQADRLVYALIDVTGPALDRIVIRRSAELRRRFYLTLVPGILAMVAAALFVLLGARSVLARAELSRIRRTAAELEYHATHDALTALPNRAAFVTALQGRIAAAGSARGTIAVLFIDLDDFKLVNDSLGHAAGDVVLCAVAERLRRIGAGPPGEIVARFGGDEFAMLVCDTRADELARRTERIVAQIADDLAVPIALLPESSARVVVSASVGIAVLGDGDRGDTPAADILRDADVAMYEAKAHGRARAATFGPAMRERAVRKLRLMNDLRGAGERAEFELAREPIVRLRDGAVIGSEALIRWRHPRLGMLAPGAFLPLAQESGAILQIGHWVLETAIGAMAAEPAALVHVNLSAQDLTEESLLTTIAALLERWNVNPNLLAIEITEGSLVRSGGRAEAMLDRLRRLGVRIWIDDFGVEYSSLRYLDRLPVDGMKIDRSFVSGADGKLASPTIVKMIVDLARSLELDVIAEGIETAEQRDALAALGCTYGQGYFFSRRNERVAAIRGEEIISPVRR